VVEAGGPAAKKFIDEVVRGGEESSDEQDSEGDRDRSHAQAGIHDGHFGSRAEELGAVFGGFCEWRSMTQC
jgi:hypothetical protein